MIDRLSLPTRYRRMVEAILCEHVPEAEVWAYGSRIQGRSHDGSDLDLVIRSPSLEPLGAELLDLIEAFQESNIPFLVQVHDWARLPESFHREIERDYVVVQKPSNHTTAGEWIHCTLADACSAIHYGLTASASSQSNGPKFLRITDIVSGQLKWNTVPHVETDGKTLAKYQLFDGDIVIARTGASTGKSAYVNNPPTSVFASYLVRLQAKPEFDARFIAYYLKSKDFSEYIDGVLGDKSAQPNASASTMTAAPFKAPRSKAEQRGIARVLGALDDKIELNRRMNETLEEMARALFKSWFVDFNPVRAKMEGRWRRGESLPGLPADLYDLFPDRLVESEVGVIPEGWGVKRLGSLLETLETGYRPPGGVSGIVSGIPSVGAESIEQVGVFDFSKTKYVPSDFYNGMKRGVIEEGDVLIYKDGGRPGELEPAVTYISKGFPFRVFCINEHVYRVRTKRFSQHLLYCYLTTSSAFWQMREFATGVAQPGLNRRAVESIAIALPANDSVLRACQERINPLLDECNINSLESWRLSQIRDALLPKLVLGEVRVGEAR